MVCIRRHRLRGLGQGFDRGCILDGWRGGRSHLVAEAEADRPAAICEGVVQHGSVCVGAQILPSLILGMETFGKCATIG